MNDTPWTQRVAPLLDPVLQEKRVKEIRGQFWPTGLHQDVLNMVGVVGNSVNLWRRHAMTWGEFARRADETLVSYEQWWHHYTNGIGQFSGEEYGRILIEFEDTRVVIEAFDSLVRDIKDLIEKYNAVDFPEKLDAFLNEFYNICDQIEVVVGRRITSEQVVIRNVRDHVEYLLDFGNAGTVLTS